jgi:signal peptidase II
MALMVGEQPARAEAAWSAARPHAISPAMLRFGLILAAVVFVLDQGSKYWILGPGAFSPVGCLEAGLYCRFVEVSALFDLRMVWNRGVSFGLLHAQDDIARWGLVALSAFIAGFFGWGLRTAERRLTAVSLGLIVGGALGNVIDRIRFGAVADFLDFHGLWFPWVFNVADAAITVGAILFVADLFFNAESEPGAGTSWGRVKQSLGLAGAPPKNGHDKG